VEVVMNTNINSMSIEELEAEVARRKEALRLRDIIDNFPNPPYNSIHGLWRVTTEGDCEGRSTKSLGVFEGSIDEIAKSLARECFYTLRFTRVESREIPAAEVPAPKSVSVSLNIESGTWDLKPNERAAVARRLFQGRPVKVNEGTYYASFVLNFEET